MIDTQLAVLKGKEISKIIYKKNEWWFSIVDEGSEVVTFCYGLKLTAP